MAKLKVKKIVRLEECSGVINKEISQWNLPFYNPNKTTSVRRSTDTISCDYLLPSGKCAQERSYYQGIPAKCKYLE